MLILSRRVNENIMVGDDVKIRILKINDNQVNVGILAPKQIAIHREEIYTKLKNEKLNDAQYA